MALKKSGAWVQTTTRHTGVVGTNQGSDEVLYLVTPQIAQQTGQRRRWQGHCNIHCRSRQHLTGGKGGRGRDGSDWGGTPTGQIGELDSSGNLLDGACFKCGQMLVFKTPRCSFQKAGRHCPNFRYRGCAKILSLISRIHDRTTDREAGGG